MKKINKIPKGPLAKNIFQLRRAKGWSQLDLAEKVGVHFNVIRNIERGINEGSVSTRQAIADALGVSVTELYKTTKTDPSLDGKRFLIIQRIMKADQQICETILRLLDRYDDGP